MANAKTAPAAERTTVYIPKMPGEDATVYVGVNGKGYLIPRGKRTEVPVEVAEVLAMSEHAADRADEYTELEQRKKDIIQGAP